MTRKKLLSFRARVVKDINEQLVLNLIQENEIISSTDLVKITGMRPSTIFNILKVLSERSLVSFHGKGYSTEKGGKKPYLWRLNKEGGLFKKVLYKKCVEKEGLFFFFFFC